MYEKKKSKKVKRKIILYDNDQFALSEAFKNVRINLLFALAANNTKKIIVTSSSPLEGKSTVVANLARAFAQNGSRVLILDADLRRPAQHKFFNASISPGLSLALLTPEGTEIINKDLEERLDLITAGQIPPNPIELLGSDRMQQILSVLDRHYDYIFIDTPPVNVVADALVLMKEDTGVIIVTKQNITTYHDLDRVIERIGVTQSPILGTLLNNSNPKYKPGGYYYGGNYKYYYKYD